MSFVTEVLSSVAKVETENLNKKIPDIASAITGHKQNVLQYCDRIYVKFLERPRNNSLLLKRNEELASTVLELENSLNTIQSTEINNCNSKITTYKQELGEAKYGLQLATTLILVHETLIHVKTSLHNKNYIEGIKQIEEVEQLLNNTDIRSIDISSRLVKKLNKTKENLLPELNNEFRNYVQCNENGPYTISFKTDDHFKDIVMALSLANSKIDLLDQFTEFFWEFVVCPAAKSDVSLDVNINDTESKLTLNVIKENEKQYYKLVFENIKKIFKFLHNNFNYSLGKDVTTLVYIGNLISDKLSELVIKNCLFDIIPKNSEELEQYKNVMEDAVQLQNELIKYSILSQNADEISSYTNNVEFQFIDKKCQEYITSAREIIKRDLHDMIEIGTPYNEITGMSNSSVFPRCFISKSTTDLIELTIKIMENAKSYEINAERLYATVQHILGIYGEVVQIHHQKLLQTIPQQVALFHNNCMYLSHKLSTSMKEYYLPSVPSSDPVLFTEKAHLLKHIGNNAFIECLEQQIKQIEEIMKESGLRSVNMLDKLDPKTEKSIRQCLRQQELLKTVWQKVLSYSDYNRSIGCILNYLCNFILNQALTIEDISSEAGDQLVDIFKVILTRGPKLFVDFKDIHLYVKNWYKFNELVFVLSSSMTEICDRWADGKGPLALQFKPEEAQKLIRALFQNTDRRAAVLARIVR